ncbi:hypothetical protein GGQ71_003821 [Rhizobium taibaishanense]|uniref:Uncharacterized protein n=1 Tax=Allorhizobium taibaishanense TaxID=887144 RepID=A0A7W6HQI3_9HYPH|nr:hypothetical protein [Allorhizobium taibaishanense]
MPKRYGLEHFQQKSAAALGPEMLNGRFQSCISTVNAIAVM